MTHLHAVRPPSPVREVLARRMRQELGLDLDRLDPARVSRVVERWSALEDPSGPMARASLQRLASGSRGEGVRVRIQPSLPEVFERATRVVGEGPLRVWIVGAASGAGRQVLHEVIRRCAATGVPCEVVLTDADPVGLVQVEAPSAPGVHCVREAGDPAAGSRPGGTFHVVMCSDLLRFVHPDAAKRCWTTLSQAMQAGGSLVVDAADPLPPEAAGLHACWRGGARLYRRVERTHATAVMTALRAGWAALACGDADGAFAFAAPLLQAHPEQPAVHVLAARCFQATGALERGLHHARQAQALDADAVVPAVVVADLTEAIQGERAAGPSRRHAHIRLLARLPGAELPYGGDPTGPAPEPRLIALR